jgi:hypothetical protein
MCIRATTDPAIPPTADVKDIAIVKDQDCDAASSQGTTTRQTTLVVTVRRSGLPGLFAWQWNGTTKDETIFIRDQSNREIDAALKRLFGG